MHIFTNRKFVRQMSSKLNPKTIFELKAGVSEEILNSHSISLSAEL